MFAFIADWVSQSQGGKFHTETINEMLRLVSECEDGVIEELLPILADEHGEGTILTVAEIKTRKIIATNARGDNGILQSIIYSINSLERKCYFLLGQKSSVVFRKGIECIRIIPLVVGRKSDYALVIEYPKQMKPLPRQYYDTLALCVETVVSKEKVAKAGQVDKLSNLKNRPLFLKEAKERLSAGVSYKIVVIAISEDALFQKGLISELSVYHGRLSELIEENTTELYCLGLGSFAFFAVGKEFDIIADVNTLIDISLEKGIEVRCGVSNLDTDEFLSLYLAEKGSREASDGQVIYVKDRDSVYTKEDVYQSFRDPSLYTIGEEVKTVSFRPYEEKKKSDDEGPDLEYTWSQSDISPQEEEGVAE